MRNKVVTLVLLGVLSCSATPVLGGGLWLYEVGSPSVGTANAGAAARVYFPTQKGFIAFQVMPAPAARK
jgi:hypothetical protein